MHRIIFISNRLPVTIKKKKNHLNFIPSIGGLATGLGNIHKQEESLWVGWCGLASNNLSKTEQEEIKNILINQYKCLPVYLTKYELDNFYYGFCNKTIWPLFHYFINHTIYDHKLWEYYIRINKLFFTILEPIIKENDTVWIHDYQLMLLPKFIKDKYPETKLGFFLHIPFPSYEFFRLLPWRKEILEGLLGADLVGFHTYDYVRHFTSSIRRILRVEHNLGFVKYNNRLIKADVFPMGIDYKKYSSSHENKNIQNETNTIIEKTRGLQVILSVDRLDYTKGIPERIKAFNLFLRENPEYREKVVMILILAPSRTKVDAYIDLRKEVEELISHTNGAHGTMGWTPIWFFYRNFSFDGLTALYSISDVLLVTPLRDGMNLVAKEYIATHIDKKGILVLSETTGAASELGEAIIINPNNIKEVSKALKEALEMPVVEQIERNSILHKRLEKYDTNFWITDFLNKLEGVHQEQDKIYALRITNKIREKIINDYRKSRKRLFLLDYDGTLIGFFDKPEKAQPDRDIIRTIQRLRDISGNEIVLISGRDKNTMDIWFSSLKINMIAGHGMWEKKKSGDWTVTENLNTEWKEIIRPVLDVHATRTPGSFVEEKDYSLSWHYRKCDPDLASLRLSELKDALMNLTSNLSIGFLDGNKVLEVKNLSINKGSGASYWLNQKDWDFILSIGDDWTDEDMFNVLPDKAYSIKVGYDMSAAKYHLESAKEVRTLLEELCNL